MNTKTIRPYTGENPWADRGVTLQLVASGGAVYVQAVLDGKVIAGASHPAFVYDALRRHFA